MPGRRQRRTHPTSGESSGELPLRATSYPLWELGPLHTDLVGDGNTRAHAGPGLCFFAGIAGAAPVTASAWHLLVPMMPLAGRGTEEQMGVLLLHFPPGTPSPQCKTVGLKNEGGRPHPRQI